MTDYPDEPGFRDPTTSRENAERLVESGRHATLRKMVWAFFKEGGEAASDDLAIKLGEKYRAIQPRVSELRALGLVEPTGRRSHGSGGGTCHVWRRVDPQPDLPLEGDTL